MIAPTGVGFTLYWHWPPETAIFSAMTTLTEIREIVESTYLGVTELRSYSKETLISSIIEMKRIYTSESVRLKEYEYKIKLLDKEIESKRIDAELEVSRGILQHSELMKDHKYGPAAIGAVSQGIATIWKGNQISEKEAEDNDLEKRIDAARSQGMRWNNADKRPGKKPTVLKKVEQWEKGYSSGKTVDLEEYVLLGYEKALEKGGGSEAFMVGVCEQMEDKLGIGPSSKYLKTRFKRNLDRLVKESMVTPAAPLMSIDDHVEEMYRRVYGDSLEGDAKKNDRIRVKGNLEREFIRCDGDITRFRRDIIKNSSYHTSLPVFIVYEEKEHDSDNSRSRDIIDGHYNDQIEKFLEEYVNEFQGK